MESNRIKLFDAGVGKNFLLTRFGERDYSILSKIDKDLISAINVLIEFYETGNILSKKEQVHFEGETGKLMEAYLSYGYSGHRKNGSLSTLVAKHPSSSHLMVRLVSGELCISGFIEH